MHFDFEYLGSDNWRFSVLLRSGQMAVREGRVESLSRLALRAQRLFEVWARATAGRTTLPIARPTQPAAPSAIRPNQLYPTPPAVPSAIRDRGSTDDDVRGPSEVRSREHPSTIPSVGVRKRTKNGN